MSDRPVPERPRDDPEELRLTAVAVAREVGGLVARMRATAVQDVTTKTSDTDVVTAADTAAERAARRLLAQWRPGEAVLGEEEGGAEVAGPGPRWVIDPIDGTVNYLYGLPWYAVSVGVQRDGESVAGAVVAPATGQTWSAARGRGAQLDGVALRVTGATELGQALVGTGFSYRPERRARQAAMVAAMLPRVRDVRRTGSAALDLCGVATGWLDGYAEHGLHRWDWAAGALVVAEAGGVLRLPTPTDDLTVAAVPGIADDLLALLAECGAGGV